MSQTGDTDSVFSDAESVPAAETPRKKRDRDSVSEMISTFEKKKKTGPSPKKKSPRASKCGISSEALAYIREIIETTIQKSMEAEVTRITKTFETKVQSLERKVEVLEGELFEREKTIEEMGKQASTFEQHLSQLSAQVEEMERHERGINLVLSSKVFGSRRPGEDVKLMAVKALRSSLPHIPVETSDLSTAHRLSRDDAIICAFHDRDLRNKVYYARTQLRNSSAPREHRLYITESLTRLNRQIYNELVTMKKEKLLWSVFSNNGLPGYKLSATSSPVRITTLQAVRQLWQRVTSPRVVPEPWRASASSRDRPSQPSAPDLPPRRSAGGPAAAAGPRSFDGVCPSGHVRQSRDAGLAPAAVPSTAAGLSGASLRSPGPGAGPLAPLAVGSSRASEPAAADPPQVTGSSATKGTVPNSQ